MPNRPLIGITIGDFNSISTELIIKIFSDQRMTKTANYVIYGHHEIFNQYRKLFNNENFQLNRIQNFENIHTKKPNIINCWEETHIINPGESTRESAQCAYKAITTAANDLKNGKINAVVTGPINKDSIKRMHSDFIGHTELFSNLYPDLDSLMFLVSENLKTATMTGHIPLNKVAENISRKKIVSKAKIMVRSLQEDFGVQKPKIAILGLNPHAGDNGAIGNEEKEIIIPAIQNLKESGFFAYGPYSADGFFGAKMHSKFDGILGMYHDQILTPFKTLAFEDGVNFTAGLPIVRTSPDHGTAFDIAGQNIADESSFRNAIFTAVDILKNRSEIKKEVKA